MADETNTKIAGNLQTFLTEQTEHKEDLNTDLPNGANIRFIQFCRGMAEGFKMHCYTQIANQSEAIMISRNREGRIEAKESLIGMDRKEKMRFSYGPQWEDKDDKKGKK